MACIRYNCTALLQTFAAKFVLEVLGAAGAIWGSSEALGLRNDSNVWFVHWLACVVGLVFLVRWLIQLHRAYRLLSRGDRRDMVSQMTDDVDDDVDGDDELALYQEGDVETGSDDMLTRSGKKKRTETNRNGLDTAVAVATEIDSSLAYPTVIRDDDGYRAIEQSRRDHTFGDLDVTISIREM
eukprot:CAMPEP_0181055672 /NCGR_PEP_ID=MMETSP1070-20121207/19322_1 /TAXON_ID=265543 /ORGANISM="Minutocellus polymorphus, Strain NH13" /LENGTH=182 /DNA_ID=CAMNT_0023134995 /DNA_START=68 /DNA_END=617 /DNA_ORIENTATION=+